MSDLLRGLDWALTLATMILTLRLFANRIGRSFYCLGMATSLGLSIPVDLLRGHSPAIDAAFTVFFLVMWRSGGGGKGGWRRLKWWAKSKLPRPSFVRLRPGLGAAPA